MMRAGLCPTSDMSAYATPGTSPPITARSFSIFAPSTTTSTASPPHTPSSTNDAARSTNSTSPA
jgi:hypothetical protein